MSLLTIQNLTMKFGGITAISDLTLDVPEGKIVSVIGPNGAGKTTVFNVVTGIYRQRGPRNSRAKMSNGPSTGRCFSRVCSRV
jgi:branched-chain amino acid transport system ATP-binding protein